MGHYSSVWKRVCFPALFSSLALLAISGCGPRNKVLTSSPPGYNLERPSVIKLPVYLEEISGIAYYPKDKSIFAICDEKARLFKLFVAKDMSIQRWKFGKDADFEDLVLVDSTFYALKSNGSIVTLRFESPDSSVVQEYHPDMVGKSEFEILYHDVAKKRLIMLCKDCEADDKNSLTAWEFDLTSMKFNPKPTYIIDVRKIEDLMNEKKVKFKPSAAAIHPITGQLYIISSVNKVLVVADQKGVPEKVYRINPGLYKQPEGLTFTPEGHLIISNEAADIGAANILVFKYQKNG